MGKVTQRDVEGIRILDLSGDYTAIEEAVLIKNAVAEAIGERPAGIIVNYGPVTRMTSGNYGVFLQSVVVAHKQAKDSDVVVKILIPDDSEVHHFIEHLKITRLDRLLEVYSDETDALNSF